MDEMQSLLGRLWGLCLGGVLQFFMKRVRTLVGLRQPPLVYPRMSGKGSHSTLRTP